MKKINLCMLGCGMVSDLYLPISKWLENGEIIAVGDIDEKAVRRQADKYGIRKVYPDCHHVAQDKDIDAVIVGTPPNVHAEQIDVLARAGKHILCEKPMASTVRDCRLIIEVCRKHGVKLQLGHMKRFMRGNQRIKAIVDSGAMGKIYMAECRWTCAVPQLIGSYREMDVTGGGTLQDHGPHCFDLVRWWTGNDILEVSASIRCVHPGRPSEDAAVVTLEHENGMISYHVVGRVSYGRGHAQDTYRLYGTDGTLVVRNEHHFPTTSLESPEIILHRPGGNAQRFEFWNGWNLDDNVRNSYPFYNQTRAFCDAILNDTEPRVTGDDGMHVMEAVIGAYVSSWKGVKVRLPFRDEVDLTALFREVKARDARQLGYDYTIGNVQKPPLSIPLPLNGSRPPRTKEKWSDEEHGIGE